jgi:hypothetical protein
MQSPLFIGHRARWRPDVPASHPHHRNQFNQIDAVLAHASDPSIALPQVHAGMDPVGHLVRRHHQCLQARPLADRTHHVQAVERKLLQRLLATVRVRTQAAAAIGRLPGVAERVAHGLRRVFERLELLHHGQRLERGAGRARTSATHFSSWAHPRGAADAAATTCKQQPAITTVPIRANDTGKRIAMLICRPLLGCLGRFLLLLGSFLVVKVTVGLDRAGQFQLARLPPCRPWASG